MNDDFNSAMRRAAELVRAGNPAGATDMIQTALAGGGLPAANLNPKLGQTPRFRDKIGRSLRETLSSLGRKMPKADDAALPVPAGARFDSGTYACAAGSRDYRVYVPDLKGAEPAGMVMMLHGCTQSPVDFAKGTGMNQIADARGLIIVYPAQSRRANMQSCWNWFAPADQMRDAGEPAILAGIARQMQADHAIPQGRTFVAGLSAGAAMAVVLGQTNPDVFAAVGAHSGLPYKAAHDVPSAFAAMGSGSTGTIEGHSTPTIVFHGDADRTVHATNGQQIADAAALSGPQLLDDGITDGRRFSRRTTQNSAGHITMEHWIIAGLGHAWSGGDSAGSYTDPKGPDASTEMVRFFLDLPVKGA